MRKIGTCCLFAIFFLACANARTVKKSAPAAQTLPEAASETGLQSVQLRTFPTTTAEVNGPPLVCDKVSLTESAMASDSISQDRPYRLSDIQCEKTYAAALLTLTDKDDDDNALLLFAQGELDWDIVAIGYGFTCAELSGRMPIEICKQLSGMKR